MKRLLLTGIAALFLATGMDALASWPVQATEVGLLSCGDRLIEVHEHGRDRYSFGGNILRVCPKTSGGITKFSEHEAD